MFLRKSQVDMGLSSSSASCTFTKPLATEIKNPGMTTKYSTASLVQDPLTKPNDKHTRVLAVPLPGMYLRTESGAKNEPSQVRLKVIQPGR